ncbi:hypothetical protein [Methanoculleus sp. UBA303]|uniref:hypothetical protein n=1 Tax=Methanoculleus sp. UBA303 TaxID=1915497 RepID=UPI0037443A24
MKSEFRPYPSVRENPAHSILLTAALHNPVEEKGTNIRSSGTYSPATSRPRI